MAYKDPVETDDTESEELPLRVPIISYGADYTVDTIAQYVKDGIIDIQPDFQRKSVWDIKKASKLIESFLLGYPVPNILLGRPQNDDRMEVIDGQQRIRTIADFLKGTFNKDTVVFRLTGDILPQYQGKTFGELEDVDQRRFKHAVLKAIILVYQDADPNIRYSVFQRINTGSVVLNQQEIRNCIFGGALNNLLHEINRSSMWRAYFSKEPDKRMRDEEALLRFYASYFYGEAYQKPMTAFLNNFMSANRNLEEERTEQWRSLFLETLEVVKGNYSGSSPYSTKQGLRQFNRAMFEAIMVAVARLKREGKSSFSDFDSKHALLLSDPDFIDSVSTGTSSEKKYAFRMRKAYETLK